MCLFSSRTLHRHYNRDFCSNRVLTESKLAIAFCSPTQIRPCRIRSTSHKKQQTLLHCWQLDSPNLSRQGSSITQPIPKVHCLTISRCNNSLITTLTRESTRIPAIWMSLTSRNSNATSLLSALSHTGHQLSNCAFEYN